MTWVWLGQVPSSSWASPPCRWWSARPRTKYILFYICSGKFGKTVFVLFLTPNWLIIFSNEPFLSSFPQPLSSTLSNMNIHPKWAVWDWVWSYCRQSELKKKTLQSYSLLIPFHKQSLYPELIHITPLPYYSSLPTLTSTRCDASLLLSNLIILPVERMATARLTSTIIRTVGRVVCRLAACGGRMHTGTRPANRSAVSRAD